MEYLKPLKDLETKVSIYRNLLVACFAALLASLVITPMLMTSGNAFIVKNGDEVRLAQKEPWRPTAARVEAFRDYYLKSRFEWNESDFSTKKQVLRDLTTGNVLSKMKDSLSAFESLIKSQNARSYYVLEGYGFSNEKHRVEARIIRILRIGKVAVATPLTIHFEFRDVGFTDANPYGAQITSLNESEVN